MSQESNPDVQGAGMTLKVPSKAPHRGSGEAMKKVECIVKPSKLEEAKDALSTLGITGRKIGKAREIGRLGGHIRFCFDAEYRIDFISKIRIELVVCAEQVAEIVDVVRRKPPSALSATAGFLSVISNGFFESGPAKRALAAL